MVEELFDDKKLIVVPKEIADRLTLVAAQRGSSVSNYTTYVLKEALRAEEMGADPLVAQSHHLLAAALQAQGNAEDAQRHRAKATEILETIRAEAGDGPLTRSDLAPIAGAGDS